jgi:hypothetical protein
VLQALDRLLRQLDGAFADHPRHHRDAGRKHHEIDRHIGEQGVLKAKSNTLPARLIKISPPLIFLDFSGPIQAVPRPSQVFRILL